jgi:hypothetical protein
MIVCPLWETFYQDHARGQIHPQYWIHITCLS